MLWNDTKAKICRVKKANCPLWTSLYSELQGVFSFLIFFNKCDSRCARDTHTFTILLKFSKENVNGKKNCDAAICKRRNWFFLGKNLHSFIFVHPCLLQALWERRMPGFRSFGVAGVFFEGLLLALFQTTDLIPMASSAEEINKQGILHERFLFSFCLLLYFMI